MIDIKAVKNRILEKAIRGELVPHMGNINQVDKIIDKISVEYLELAKRKETKISKTAEMNSDEIFEIPENWKWVPLGKLCIMLSRGKSPKYSEEKKYPVFAQKCNQPYGLELWKALFLDPDTLEKWPEYLRLRDKDVVINSTGTGTVGRIGYYTSETLNDNYPFMLPDSHVTVVRMGDGIVSKYIYYVLRSISLQTIMEKSFRGSTNQKEFYIDSVYATPIPVPPTEEQVLIVEKLDAVFEQLKVIDGLQQQYSSDLEVLKSKIIDAGIQGKLTEQLPEDGTAEELLEQIAEEKKLLIKEKKIKATKALPEITEDEIPFEIPDNWKWVRLSEIMDVRDGTHDSPKYVEDGIPLVTSKNISSGGLDFTNVNYISQDDANKINERSNVDTGDILFAMIGTIGNPVIVEKDREFCIKNVALFKNFAKDKLDIRYVYWMLMREQYVMKKKAIGGLQPFISLKVFREYPVPLPPIAEQRRIADKLDDVISMC